MTSLCGLYHFEPMADTQGHLLRLRDRARGCKTCSWPFSKHYVTVYELDSSGRPVLARSWFESSVRLDWFPDSEDKRIGGPFVFLGLN